ncbi:MAG: GNAT family N-acetyltransferase [Bacteroidetes bacterium]|nr:GNAT family N-acetyltransferase [Bacteroidota bacterium]
MQPSGAITEHIPGEYRLERLTRSTCGDLARLYKAVHGKNSSAAYFEKKYDTSYTGFSFMGFLAYNQEGQPVAFNGLQPCFISYKGEKVIAAQNIDIMTDPNHRYKGMFVGLSRCLFELAKANNILLLFGFPNQQSYYGTVNKLNWKKTEHMSLFRVPVKSFWLIKGLRKIKALSFLYQWHRNRVLKKFRLPGNGLVSSALEEGFAGLWRDEAFLTWKTYNASLVIGLAGAKIWISDRYYLMIGDMEGVTEQNFEAVMKKLTRVARRLGISEIQLHLSPGTGLYRIWAQHIQPVESYPVLFQDFGAGLPPEQIKFSFADIDIF